MIDYDEDNLEIDEEDDTVFDRDDPLYHLDLKV
jgi:hypothetical protein